MGNNNLRLEKSEYENNQIYFITICVKNRKNILGKIINEPVFETKIMVLSKIGIIVECFFKKSFLIYKDLFLYDYCIMPNHIHFILLRNIYTKNKRTNISTMIQQFKISITKHIKKSIWQDGYYERIIRNEREFYKVKNYIDFNVENYNEKFNFYDEK